MRKTNVGDFFEVNIENNQKRYFQLICLDKTQLNNEVICVSKGAYSKKEKFDFIGILKKEVDFYAHTTIKLGIKI